MSDNVGIKIIPENCSAKCISIIRGITAHSIGEIRNSISKGQYVVEYPYTDDEGVKLVIECYSQLEQAGIPVQLFEHDRPTNIEMIKNLDGLYDEISAQVDASCSAEEDNDK